MKQTFKATAKKLPEGLQVESSTGKYTILLDEPEELGGTDAGMNPVEAVLCALGGCQAIVAFAFARLQKIHLEGFWLELEGDLDPDGFMGKNPNVRNGFSETRFTMHMKTDASQEEAERFADFIESRCPVGDNLTNGVPLVRSGVVVES